MSTSRLFITASLLCVSLVGCSTGWPQARLAHFLGPVPALDTPSQEISKARIEKAGLVVINDTSAKGDAPELSKKSFDSLKNYVQGKLTKAVDIDLVSLNSSNMLPTALTRESLLKLGQSQGLNYVVLVILSSTEIEVPDRLPVQGPQNAGGLLGELQGYRAQNYALAELALLDVQSRDVLLRANGQSWASLERLFVPLKSRLYPVVRRNLEVPPIYPTSEAVAHDVMRAVASSEAIDQAVMHFQESWNQAKG